MTAHIDTMTGAVDRRWDDMQFRVVFALSFPVFLVGAVATRLIPNLGRETQNRSVFAQAWEASGTTAQIAFSG
jgi:hypothetical protein